MRIVLNSLLFVAAVTLAAPAHAQFGTRCYNDYAGGYRCVDDGGGSLRMTPSYGGTRRSIYTDPYGNQTRCRYVNDYAGGFRIACD